jgi:hypothetical protein
MRHALFAVILLLAGCSQAGGNPDGSMLHSCMQDTDCPSPDGGACDVCTYPGNYYHCQAGYCCCTCKCEI